MKRALFRSRTPLPILVPVLSLALSLSTAQGEQTSSTFQMPVKKKTNQ